MTVLFPISAGTLPTGICFSSEQARLNAFASLMQAIVTSGSVFINIGDTKPAPEFNEFPWIRTTDGRIYFFSGVWRTPTNHDVNERRIYRGDTTELQTYDGGDTGSPSAQSGPMWEIDPDLNGCSPMGVGAIPNSNPAKTLALDEQYGEGTHLLVTAEMPKHYHPIVVNQDEDKGGGGCESGYTTIGGGEVDGNLNKYDLMNCTESSTAANVGGDTAHQNTHPVVGVYFIRWTGRLFYVVP